MITPCPFLCEFPGMKKVLAIIGNPDLSSGSESDLSESSIQSTFPDVELCCIPDYLLEATSDYREGKQYYESSLFDEASSKFANAVTIIATNDPLYMQMNSFFSPLTSVIVSFVNMKCDQSLGKKLSHSTDGGDVTIASSMTKMKELFDEQPEQRVQSNSQCRHIAYGQKSPEKQELTGSVEAVVQALQDEERTLPVGCSEVTNRTYLNNDLLQGVICAMLADIVMALALCHQLKGECREFHDLYHASNRLHTMLYGADTIKPIISSGNLARLFSKEDFTIHGEFQKYEIIATQGKESFHDVALDDSTPHVYFGSTTTFCDNDVGLCGVID